MRRNIGCHTYRNTGSSVYQKIWITGWQNNRLSLCLIEVWLEINCIFVDICQHFHGNLAQTCLCVSHGCCPVTIYRTKVSMSVYQRISGRPFLCHIYKCTINRTVTMWVIFTHCITDNTRTFTMWLVRTIIQLYHGIQYTTLNRFQTISYIRQCSGSDNAHCIVNVRVLHGLFQIHLVDFVKNIIFHLSILPIIRYPDSLQILHSLQ